MQSLIEAHDDVAAKNYEVLPEEFPQGQSMLMMPSSQIFPMQTTDAIRMVGIRKNPDEPLVITFIILSNLMGKCKIIIFKKFIGFYRSQ